MPKIGIIFIIAIKPMRAKNLMKDSMLSLTL